MVIGRDITRIGCIDVCPEGGSDFKGPGGKGRSSTTNNRAGKVVA